MSEYITQTNVIDTLSNNDNILIICHKNPDGDTLGSAAALYWALKALRKNAAIICHDDIPPRYDYMQIEVFENQFEPQFVVAIDLASVQLFGENTVDWSTKCDLSIDHHPTNTGFAKQTFLNETAAATAEMMYRLLIDMNIAITPVIANCLYTGIATDTGCFKFTNTTGTTHKIAAELIELGADFINLNSILFESKSPRRLKIESLALHSLEYYYSGRCAVIIVTRENVEETGVDNTDLEGLTGIPRAIEGVEVGITMRQQPTGSYKVSIRTSKHVNACNIATRLGGGGHRQAAGCEIIGSVEFAKTAILAEIAKELNLEPSTQTVEVLDLN